MGDGGMESLRGLGLCISRMEIARLHGSTKTFYTSQPYTHLFHIYDILRTFNFLDLLLSTTNTFV